VITLIATRREVAAHELECTAEQIVLRIREHCAQPGDIAIMQ
jgi:hypothetical protein